MLAEHSFLPHVPLAPEPTAPLKALTPTPWVQGGVLWHLHYYFQTTIALCLHSAAQAFANRFSLQFLIPPLGPPQGPPPHPALSLKAVPSILAPILTMGTTLSARPRQPFNAKHLTELSQTRTPQPQSVLKSVAIII